MLDVKGDKERWVKVNCDPNMPFFSPQLYVDETYYDAIIEEIDELQDKLKHLQNGLISISQNIEDYYNDEDDIPVDDVMCWIQSYANSLLEVTENEI